MLAETIAAAQLHKHEKKLSSVNLALVLVHDALLASGGFQAGDGPLKQAVSRHKTRLSSEMQRIKIKRGVSSNAELAASADARAGELVTLRGVQPATDRQQQVYRVMYGSTH